ncbi:hypothetical protein [Paenibacillus sp. GYB003]|uniref:hypothetical protein n=1 Tax=Paenibacillus sp. GYB003 TaxID=2994392 RepID=UPI002F96D644
MKKRKLPGENISLKTKKNESDAIMEWINSQSNLMDSIRYLIENEIRENGLRNLQHFIPSDRPMIPADAARTRAEAAAALDLAPGPSAEKRKPEPDDIDDEDIESWL